MWGVFFEIVDILEMWRESLIFERDGSWMRFGLPTKKVQRSDLGSTWFIGMPFSSQSTSNLNK